LEKETGKVGRLTAARAGLVVFFFGMTAGGLLLVGPGPSQLDLGLLAAASGVLMLYSLASGDDGCFIWAWAVQGFVWAGAYPVLDPSASLLMVIAFASAAVASVDAAHLLGLVYPMALFGTPVAESESAQAWRLVSAHLAKDLAIGTATFLATFGTLAFVLPLSMVTGPLLRTSVFAALALVMAWLLVIDRRKGE